MSGLESLEAILGGLPLRGEDGETRGSGSASLGTLPKTEEPKQGAGVKQPVFPNTSEDDAIPLQKANFEEPSKAKSLVESIESAGYDLTYLKPILQGIGNQLVISSAGSGKTTGLMFKILYDFVSGRFIEKDEAGIPRFLPIWLGTFLKSGQEDLKYQLQKRCKEVGIPDLSRRIHVNTLHSEFYQVCQLLGYSVNIIDDQENRTLFGKAMRNNGFKYSQADMNEAYSESINMRGSLHINPQFRKVLADWKLMRYQKGFMDFEDLQEEIYTKAVVQGREEVIDLISNRYRRIYLDEFQDVSRIQYEILKVYARGKGEGETLLQDRTSGAVVVIGDDDQSIYSWRGANVEFLTKKFPSDYHAKVYPNPVNYRTPDNILKVIAPSIAYNTERYAKQLQAANRGGRVRVLSSSSLESMSTTMSQLVEEDIMAGRTVAILVRVNSDGIMPAVALSRRGLSYNLSNREMTLSGSIGNHAQGMLDLASNSYGTYALQALSLLVSDRTRLEALRNFMRGNHKGLFDIDEEDYRYSFSDETAELFIQWRRLYQSEGASLQLLISMLKKATDTPVSRLSPYALRQRAVLDMLISLARDMIQRSSDADESKSAPLGIHDLAKLYRSTRSSLETRYENFKSGKSSPVTVASVHEFKGKEADSVYVWNLSRGVFPLERDTDLEEERRICYIACTRARQIETLVTLRGSESRFFSEMNLKDVEYVNEVLNGQGILHGAKKSGENQLEVEVLDW